MTDSIRVVLADDHPMFVDGLRAALEHDQSIALVGVAVDGRDAVAQACELQPDVVVMDLHMPELDGIEATRALATEAPSVRVLVLTMFEQDESIWAAIRAGARGYLLKGARQQEIVRAIHAVAAGEMLLGPAIASRMNEFFASGQREAPVAFPDLTTREREILDLIASGSSNAQIAQRLYLSAKTVRNNITNIFRKLDVTDRAQAIVKAREAGLGAD
jgi:DNA-binding NarL/FixJ family response regulator